MPDALAEAKEVLKERLRQLDEERKRVESALTHLDDAGPRTQRARKSGARAATRAVRPSAARRAARTSRPRRSIASPGQRRQQLITYLKANPGSRPRAIAQALEISPSNAQNVLKAALAEGTVVKRKSNYSLDAKASSR